MLVLQSGKYYTGIIYWLNRLELRVKAKATRSRA